MYSPESDRIHISRTFMLVIQQKGAGNADVGVLFASQRCRICRFFCGGGAAGADTWFGVGHLLTSCCRSSKQLNASTVDRVWYRLDQRVRLKLYAHRLHGIGRNVYRCVLTADLQ